MDNRGFASDNNAGVHPEIMKAIDSVNSGHTIAYGELVSSDPSVVECLIENPRVGFFLVVVARDPGATSEIEFGAQILGE